MKVIGLNNREYNLNLTKYRVKPDQTRPRSSLHIKARELIKTVLVGCPIYEEVKLPGSTNPSKKSVLFLDFFIPKFSLGIEVHGRQHYEYCQFFHETKSGFAEHKRRDSLKESWCEVNDITLIVLSYEHDVTYWRRQLVNHF